MPIYLSQEGGEEEITDALEEYLDSEATRENNRIHHIAKQAQLSFEAKGNI